MKIFRGILIVAIIIGILVILSPIISNHLKNKQNNIEAQSIADTIGEASTNFQDTCPKYTTEINSDFDIDNYQNGDVIGYAIFPTISQEKWTVAKADLDSSSVDNIMSYSLALDSDTESLGEPGNTVMFGHNYLALKDIEDLFDDGYVVLKIEDNTYVYKTYEQQYIDAYNSEYVYSSKVDESENIESRVNAIVEPMDTLTLYTCTQHYPGPITGRTVVKMDLVAEFNGPCE